MAEHFCPGCLEQTDTEDEACSGCEFERPDLGWPVDETIGKVVNQKYRILERLGRGGFGVVMRGRHLHDEHDLGDVVLKFMQSSLSQDLSLRRRFINEAKAARSLRSPHVVKVFDFDFDEHGVPFMVMEYLEGESLSRVIRRRPLTVRRTLRIAAQLAGAMDECHAAGIIHRDLKPSNILLLPGRRGDFAKIIDFGIARVDDSTVTKTMMGTPKYMAPEQILRGEMDGRTDVFALGIIIHECLCGSPPIKAGDDLQYLMLNLNASPTPLREVVPDAPVALEGLLLRMMAKDREDRPASMADVEARLGAIDADGEGNADAASGALENGDTLPLDRAGSEATREARVPAQPSGSVTLGSWLFGEDFRLPENRGRQVAVGGGAVALLGLLTALLVMEPCAGVQRSTAGGGGDTGDVAAGETRPPDAGPVGSPGGGDASLFLPRASRRVAGLVRPAGSAPDAGKTAVRRPRPAKKGPRKPRRPPPKPYPKIKEDGGLW